MKVRFAKTVKMAAVLTAWLVAALASADPLPQPSNANAGSTFPIADVIAQVKRELAAAQNTPSAKLGLSLESVELNFALTSTTDENGKATIAIPIGELGVNGEKKAEQTSSLDIVLVPPKASGLMGATETREFGITRAIVDTRDQLAKGVNDPPQLNPNKVTITLKFAVTKSTGPAGKIQFLIFSVGGGVTATTAASNTITLTFSKMKKP